MEPQPKRRRGWLIALGIAIVIAAGGALVWYGVTRLERIERRLSDAEQRSEGILRQMTEYSRELEAAIRRARDAVQRAEQSQAAQVQAESARAAAESRATRVQAEAEQARAAAQQTQAELQEVRQRRNQELQRMQEALNRIAPTRRTPLGMVVELADNSFKFDFDQAALRPENREMLSRIAGVLLASEGYRLFVYGHTDDVGTDEYNRALSERRAQAVADYLIKAGVPADIITTKGYGKSSPRAQGRTSEARQRNRRVEIGVVDTIINYQQNAPTR